MPAERFFFYPLITGTSGSGHFRRSMETAGRLTGTGRAGLVVDPAEAGEVRPAGVNHDVPVWSITPADPRVLKNLLSGNLPERAAPEGAIPEGVAPGAEELPALKSGFNRALAVFDRKSSSVAQLEPWVLAGATPVLLDDDGPARIRAPLVLDTIPGPRRTEANIATPMFLDLPPNRRKPDAGGASVLVSFGGSDPAGLTLPVVRSLIDDAGFSPGRIHLTLPASADSTRVPEGVGILEQAVGLRDRLGDYGLVVCSYGITAWEALSAGCAVLTVEPTGYHRRLSRTAGIPGIGKVRPRAVRGVSTLSPAERHRLATLLSDPESLNKAATAASAPLRESPVSETEPDGTPGALAGFLAGLEAPRAVCAACGAPLPVVIARFSRRSFYRCGRCGITGLYRFELKEDEYGPAYFQQEYRNQYGRSYLEDFDAIKAMALPRLRAISRKQLPGACLLDIGCAFGPFLLAALEAGYRPCGADVSREGTDHVRDVLGIPAAAGAFPDFDPAAHFGVDGFDVVSLWYVIEHFPDLKSVMEALNRLLRTGGVLAMSTPNLRGITGRRSLRRFLENSPRDHYTVWSPGNSRRMLKRFGFRVYRIRVTGHHPERFGVKMRSGGILFRIIGMISRFFRLGDTFELYAVKERPLG